MTGPHKREERRGDGEAEEHLSILGDAPDFAHHTRRFDEVHMVLFELDTLKHLTLVKVVDGFI